MIRSLSCCCCFSCVRLSLLPPLCNCPKLMLLRMHWTLKRALICCCCCCCCWCTSMPNISVKTNDPRSWLHQFLPVCLWKPQWHQWSKRNLPVCLPALPRRTALSAQILLLSARPVPTLLQSTATLSVWDSRAAFVAPRIWRAKMGLPGGVLRSSGC